jgi:phage major head subunit gpT-like protein
LGGGGPITVVGGNERSLVVYNQDWEVAIGVEHNAINDNRVGSLEAWALNAGSRFEQHKDYLAISALNSGDAATYGYGYDKQELFCATHTDPGAEYQTAQDNEYDSALTLDNFETVRVAASKFLDGRGQPVGYTHNLLVVPSDYERTATQITANREDYATANRKMNPYAGAVRLLVVPGGWMDSTAWFIVDDTQVAKPINLQVRQAPQLVYWDDETQGSGIRYYKWTARYVPFYGDWRLVCMGDS